MHEQTSQTSMFTLNIMNPKTVKHRKRLGQDDRVLIWIQFKQ